MAPHEADFLRLFTDLKRRFPPDLARAALEIAILRLEAAVKFTQAERMYFTRPALEQSSSEEISSYRAQRYRSLPLLADLGCSIGGDTIHLAKFASTIGVDHDPLRLEMARANLAALNLVHTSHLVQADLLVPLPLRTSLYSTPTLYSTPHAGIFFDPARRAAGKRVFSIHDYQPPLAILRQWQANWPAIGVKISPGVRLDELASYDAEIEFISLRGELKEAVLWFGPLKTAHRKATLLPGPYTLAVNQPSEAAQLPHLSKPLAYLYEPDPTVLRAGLVRLLAEQLEASQLDTEIAYLTSDQYHPTPFARAWPVEAWFPFNLKRLRVDLKSRGVTGVTVKKRGSPLQPEDLIHSLRLNPHASPTAVERVLFLTHLRGQPIVVLCLPEVRSPQARDLPTPVP
jgi:SAM-dependent methyltransferase